MFGIYKHYSNGIPDHLARYYWWAYLWSKAVWFFDHQPIINTILFGQYKALMAATSKRLKAAPLNRVLQLTCVYGSLTPTLLQLIPDKRLHITDAATVQLHLAQSKIFHNETLLITRMNAEQLGYKNDSFSTIILFFLLHEMPHVARINTLNECIRTLETGGSLIMTEYASLPTNHLLYRFRPTRYVITKLEPFLNNFWQEDVLQMLKTLAQPMGKQVKIVSQNNIFFSFYSVTEYRIITMRS